MADITRERTQAVCGAYLSVAFADGRFDHSEKARLLGGLIHDPELSNLDTDLLTETYNDFVDLFSSDYTKGLESVLQTISTVRHEDGVSAMVSKAARTAIVADNALAPQEEIVLRKIESALGLEEYSL